MKTIILSIAFTLLNLATSQRSPTISFISPEEVKDIGETVQLECAVQHAQEYPVIWMKLNANPNTPTVLSTNAALIITDRLALKHDKASSTYTLTIRDIQETDAGYYQCSINLNLMTSINAKVELKVRRPPIISDNSSQSVIVNEKDPVYLECYASGYPTPRISWRRENNAVLPTGNSVHRGNILKVPSIKKEDRGTYYCVAENGVGHGSRRNINVQVEFAPVITVNRPRLGQALQYDMNLECHVDSYPLPTIQWLKDGIQLSNNQHHQISLYASDDENTDTTLQVITIEKKQYGNYVCKAVNKLGPAEATIELFETIIPVCPPACGQVHYSSGIIQMYSGLLIASVLFVVMAFHFRH